MLNFGAEYGLRGYIEPAQYLTDANKAGVEKLAVCAVKPEMLTTMPISLPKFNPLGQLAPMSVFLVKGWSRSVAAVALLLYAYDSPDSEELLQAWASVPGLQIATGLKSRIILSSFRFHPEIWCALHLTGMA
eukprot:s2636_g13.t1